MDNDQLLALEPHTRRYLRDFVARARWVRSLARLGWGLLAVGAATLIACLVDRYLGVTAALRGTLLATELALAVALGLAALAARWRRRPDWIAVAQQIELRDPRWNQRLATVVSRFLGGAAYRGSDELLDELAQEVERLASQRQATRLLSGAGAARIWLLVALVAAAWAALALIPSVGLGRLSRRFVEPWASLAPVTTTQIELDSGDCDVVQSQSLTIKARAQRLGAHPLWIFTRDSAGPWSQTAMRSDGRDQFAYTFSSVDSDFQYYIAGGDATSERHVVRVMRHPAVAEFRIRYEYPDYTGLAPLEAANADGLIEAPVNTQALLTITATEPLDLALLTIGNDKVLMAPTAAPNVWSAQFAITHDAACDLTLVSARKMTGAGPAAMRVHAIADRPPVARILTSSNAVLMSAGASISLPYQVYDEYGLDRLEIRAQVGAEPTSIIPLRVTGAGRNIRDTYLFDPSILAHEPRVGAVITLLLAARDRAGHESFSEPVHLVVAAHAIDAAAPERLVDLEDAQEMTDRLSQNLADAALAAAAISGPNADPAMAAQRDRQLSNASQSAELLVQALLRATMRSRDVALSTALASWIDQAQAESFAADQLFRAGGAGLIVGSAEDQAMRQGMARQQAASSAMAAQIKTIIAGQRAALLANSRQMLAALEAGAAASGGGGATAEQAASSARKQLSAGATKLGLSATQVDLDSQLTARIAAADAMVRVARDVDFAAAAAKWAQQLLQPTAAPSDLAGRLDLASQAEALREDANLPRAHDLQLASQAVAQLGAAPVSADSSQAEPRADPHTLGQLVDDIAFLQQADRRREPSVVAAGQDPSIAVRAAAARAQLSSWAGSMDGGDLPLAMSTPSTAPADLTAVASPQRSQSLAMAASAAAALHDYQRATALDQRLGAMDSGGQASGGDTQSPLHAMMLRVAATMAEARQLDNLEVSQRQLAVDSASDPASAAEQASKQREVAEQIAAAQRRAANGGLAPDADPQDPTTAPLGQSISHPWENPDWREQATQSIVLAQEQLAAMPAQLSDLQSAATAWRQAQAGAAAAHAGAAAAQADQKAAAQRDAAQADADLADAARRLDQTAQPLSESVARTIAQGLGPIIPDASGARDALSLQLEPALSAVSHSIRAADRAAADRAVASARLAVEAAQRQLGQTQDALTARDPLVAAKWFARAAADELGQRNADIAIARAHQRAASSALSHAWDQRIHLAAAERLAALSAPAPLATRAAGEMGIVGLNSLIDGPTMPWAGMRAVDGGGAVAPLLQAAPPGYQEQLRLYFQALNQPRNP